MAKKEKELKAPKQKSARKLQKEAIKDEKKKIEVKIDAKFDELKATKDKAKRKEIKKDISELRKTRSHIGKKDTFFGDVLKEMKLVRWPSKEEMLKYSIAVIGFIVFFALFFIGIDALFAAISSIFNK